MIISGNCSYMQIQELGNTGLWIIGQNRFLSIVLNRSILGRKFILFMARLRLIFMMISGLILRNWIYRRSWVAIICGG